MRDPATIKAYHRRKLAARIAGLMLALLCLLAWSQLASSLTSWLSATTASRWANLVILAAAVFGSLEILSLPLGFYSGYLLERRFGLTGQTVRAWLIRSLKEYAVGGVIGLIVLAGLYGLLWYGGSLWWLWLWCGWVGLMVVLARLFPTLILPIFYRARPVQDQPLRQRLGELAAASGLSLSDVHVLDLSKETHKVNAALAGLGRSRRVLLADTLLARFDLPQIAVVFAHELAHHRRRHVWKLLAVAAVSSTLVVAAVTWMLIPLAGPAAQRWPAAVAALPRVALAAMLAGLVLQPAVNALSRRFELQADRDALSLTGDPASYRSAYLKLAETNLADPNPHRLVEWYFYDHPALSRRLALAEQAPLQAHTQ